MIPLSMPKIRVLLVEDEPFIRGTFTRILRSLGCTEVREAPDGTEALAVLSFGFRPDLVLCDVRMAPMDGLGFLAHLRKSPDPVLAKTPVIMLTGATDEASVRAARGLGVGGYLVKPVSPGALAERVKQVLCTAPPSRSMTDSLGMPTATPRARM
jgi:two-component system chemotaxis response regulator CheY